MVERRTAPRRGSGEAGEVVLNPSIGPVECTISNVGVNGARLKFLKPILLPREFELAFESGHRTRVKVAWQRGLVAGVRFKTPMRMAPEKRRSGMLARLLGAGA